MSTVAPKTISCKKCPEIMKQKNYFLKINFADVIGRIRFRGEASVEAERWNEPGPGSQAQA